MPSGRGELEITEAIQWLIDHGRRCRSTIISGYWKDTGNVADMLEVNRMVLESMPAAVAGHGRRRERAHRPGGRRGGRRGDPLPALWARPSSARARVSTDSYIGPFTVGGARTAPSTDSEIEYSIVLRGASIRGVRRIEASLIGRDVEVTPAPEHAQGAPAGAGRPQQGADQLMSIAGSWPAPAGMLGRDLVAALQRRGADVIPAGPRRSGHDRPAAVAARCNGRPAVVVNCAAWTAVDVPRHTRKTRSW